MKAEFKDDGSLSKGAGSRGVRSGEFCHCDSVATVLDALTKLYRCVVEIKMKAKD